MSVKLTPPIFYKAFCPDCGKIRDFDCTVECNSDFEINGVLAPYESKNTTMVVSACLKCQSELKIEADSDLSVFGMPATMHDDFLQNIRCPFCGRLTRTKLLLHYLDLTPRHFLYSDESRLMVGFQGVCKCWIKNHSGLLINIYLVVVIKKFSFIKIQTKMGIGFTILLVVSHILNVK